MGEVISIGPPAVYCFKDTPAPTLLTPLQPFYDLIVNAMDFGGEMLVSELGPP
jgi:hypothetical protein